MTTLTMRLRRYAPVAVGWMLAAVLAAASAAQTPGAKGIAPKWIRTKTGLTYQVLVIGTGAVARVGQYAVIHETTTFVNGKVIYSSRAKGVPVTFLLGAKQVIAGVEEGVIGMRVGERRLVNIPPALSQRKEYPADTPKDSTLRIDIELIEIRKK